MSVNEINRYGRTAQIYRRAFHEARFFVDRRFRRDAKRQGRRAERRLSKAIRDFEINSNSF